MTKKKIFISYKRNVEPDESLAHKIYQHLHEKYGNVFMDVKGIRGGEGWGGKIKDSILNADYFVCLISNDAINSDMVIEEIAIAYRHKKQHGVPIIVSVMLGDVELNYELGAYLNRTYQIFNIPDILQELDSTIEGTYVKADNANASKKARENKISHLIEIGLYTDAYKKCVGFLADTPDNPTLNLLAGISHFLETGENKLRSNNLKLIERHTHVAVQDKKTRSTALAILGCIKHSHFEPTGQFDPSSLTLEKIKRELKQHRNDDIDYELLQQIEPASESLDFLGIT